MSEGLTEDLSYYHEDVITAARNEQIIISTIGYPRLPAQPIAVQTLRRLSEETGGLYTQADPDGYTVSNGFFTRSLTAYASSGRFRFALDKITRTEVDQHLEMSLLFRTTEQTFYIEVPVIIPALDIPEKQPLLETLLTDSTLPGGPVTLPDTPAQTEAEAKPMNQPVWPSFWYDLPTLVFSLNLAVVLGYAWASRRRREDTVHPFSLGATIAFLLPVKDVGVRHIVDQTPWRIGRSRAS
jgi:hypothetical protein